MREERKKRFLRHGTRFLSMGGRKTLYEVRNIGRCRKGAVYDGFGTKGSRRSSGLLASSASLDYVRRLISS